MFILPGLCYLSRQFLTHKYITLMLLFQVADETEKRIIYSCIHNVFCFNRWYVNRAANVNKYTH